MPSACAIVAAGTGPRCAREVREDRERLVGRRHLRWLGVTRQPTPCLGSRTRCRDRGIPARAGAVWNRRHEHHRAHPVHGRRGIRHRRHRTAVASTTSSPWPATGHPSSSTRPPSTGVAASRAIIEGLAADPEPHYGISTGFGALATTFIADDRRAQLQASLVRSHAAGSGAEVEREVVRALMLLRLLDAHDRPHRRAPRDRRDLRRDAQRRHHADRARVRLARLLGRPRPARALRARRDGRGRGARRRRRARRMPRAPSPPPASRPLASREKEGLALINGTDGMLGMLAARDRRPPDAARPPPTSPPR